jgi:glucan phosphoethanolaminetransferase (alkaline phosphatase superfamily)
VGKSNPDMFGVVIHANVINMLMTENYINQVPMYLKVILAVTICYLAVFILYVVFLAFPLLYGTLSKIVQFVLWIAVLFVIIGVFYNYKLKYDADLAVVTVLLAGDMVEIYHELVLPTVMKLYRLISVKK